MSSCTSYGPYVVIMMFCSPAARHRKQAASSSSSRAAAWRAARNATRVGIGLVGPPARRAAPRAADARVSRRRRWEGGRLALWVAAPPGRSGGGKMAHRSRAAASASRQGGAGRLSHGRVRDAQRLSTAGVGGYSFPTAGRVAGTAAAHAGCTAARDTGAAEPTGRYGWICGTVSTKPEQQGSYFSSEPHRQQAAAAATALLRLLLCLLRDPCVAGKHRHVFVASLSSPLSCANSSPRRAACC